MWVWQDFIVWKSLVYRAQPENQMRLTFWFCRNLRIISFTTHSCTPGKSVSSCERHLWSNAECIRMRSRNSLKQEVLLSFKTKSRCLEVEQRKSTSALCCPGYLFWKAANPLILSWCISKCQFSVSGGMGKGSELWQFPSHYLWDREGRLWDVLTSNMEMSRKWHPFFTELFSKWEMVMEKDTYQNWS